MNLLTWKDCCALMTECIDIKPVTCRKGRKVPFAVTRHILRSGVDKVRERGALLPGNYKENNIVELPHWWKLDI